VPVVHVRALACDLPAAAAALPAIARAVADAVPCTLDGVWCTFQALAAETLGERAVESEGRIVYVDLAIRARSDSGAAGRALGAACIAAATAFAVPIEDVWGRLQPVESGSVFAGGGLVD
jgi:hypothetical protein